MAQSVKHLALDFNLGHDLTVCEFKPHVGLCTGSVDPAWDSLSPSLSDPSLLEPSLLSLKTNKQTNKQLKKLRDDPLILLSSPTSNPGTKK